MNYKDIDISTKRQIGADYMDLNNSSVSIIKKHDINTHMLMRIIDELNIPRRTPSRQGRRKAKVEDPQKRICPCCHKVVDNREARFCWNCGSDVRMKEQILTEQLDRIMGDISKFYPANARDDAMKVLIETKKYLKDAINT